MRLTEQQIAQITDILKRKPVLKAFVFGSYARNEADNNSDIDLLVELDYSQHIGYSFVAIQRELEEELHKKVDLIPSDGLSKHIGPHIEREKQIIYEKT